MLPFVLLGDFRVFALWLGVMRPELPLGRTLSVAAAWTAVVPAIAWLLHRLADAALGPLPDQTLWLVYEIAFAVLAVWWATRLIPGGRPVAERFLRATAWYVATYYALWALADVLILAGLDVGLGAARRAEPALLRLLGAGRLLVVLRAAVCGDQDVDPDAQIARAARAVGARADRRRRRPARWRRRSG